MNPVLDAYLNVLSAERALERSCGDDSRKRSEELLESVFDLMKVITDEQPLNGPWVVELIRLMVTIGANAYIAQEHDVQETLDKWSNYAAEAETARLRAKEGRG